MGYRVVIQQTSQSFEVDESAPAMIADAKHAFLAQGADLAHVYTDGFSFQHASAQAPAPAA